MTTRIELYRDKTQKKQWRWRAKRAGRIVCTCAEGYSSLTKCRRSMANLLASFANGEWTSFVLLDAKQ